MKIKGKRKREQLKLIKWHIKLKYSANRIQKELQKRNLGLRRKVLLEEIRVIKKQIITKEKRIKHIPKKYKPKVVPIKKPVSLFRVSYIIPSVPVHSRPFKRHYLGFRLNAFSTSKKYLLRNHNRLKSLLIKLASEYLKANILEWNYYDVSIGVEFPVVIFVSEKLNNIWIFAVEDEGKEVYTRSGSL